MDVALQYALLMRIAVLASVRFITSGPRRGRCSVVECCHAFQACKQHQIALPSNANTAVMQLQIRRQRMIAPKSNPPWCHAVPLDDVRRVGLHHFERHRRRQAAHL